jgi:hypothetical protein
VSNDAYPKADSPSTFECPVCEHWRRRVERLEAALWRVNEYAETIQDARAIAEEALGD